MAVVPALDAATTQPHSLQRYLGIDVVETFSILPGLSGISYSTLPTFLDAIDALKKDIELRNGIDLDACAQQAMDFAVKCTNRPGEPLSVDMIASLHFYTQETIFYQVLNRRCRTHFHSRFILTGSIKLLELLIFAIYHSPVSHGVFYRGSTSDVRSSLPDGASMTWWAPEHATRNRATIEGIKGIINVLCIQDGTAFDISRYAATTGEDYYILAPYSRFVVHSSTNLSPNVFMIIAKQQPLEYLFPVFEAQPPAPAPPLSRKPGPPVAAKSNPVAAALIRTGPPVSPKPSGLVSPGFSRADNTSPSAFDTASSPRQGTVLLFPPPGGVAVLPGSVGFSSPSTARRDSTTPSALRPVPDPSSPPPSRAGSQSSRRPASTIPTVPRPVPGPGVAARRYFVDFATWTLLELRVLAETCPDPVLLFKSRDEVDVRLSRGVNCEEIQRLATFIDFKISRLLVPIIQVNAPQQAIPAVPAISIKRPIPVMYKKSWGTPGHEVKHFDKPSSIAVDGPGNNKVFVADKNNHRVQVFTSDGAFVRAWGARGNGRGEFAFPHSIALGPDQTTVFVVDQGNCRIQVLDRLGFFRHSWGSAGSGPSQFFNPKGIAISPDGRVFLADAGNCRVQVFDLSGALQVIFGQYGDRPQDFLCPSDVAVTSDGAVLVLDVGAQMVKEFLQEGAKIRLLNHWSYAFQGPTAITVGHDSRVYVTDQFRVLIFKRDGTYISTLGASGGGRDQLKCPEGISVGRDDRVYVADTYNDQVTVFTP